MLRQHLAVKKFLKRVQRKRRRQVVQEFLLVDDQGVKESVQILVNHVGGGFDTAQILLQLSQACVVFLLLGLLLGQGNLFLQQLKLLLLMQLNRVELRADFQLLFALSLVEVRLARIFFAQLEGLSRGGERRSQVT